jgi:hypothetical protein
MKDLPIEKMIDYRRDTKTIKFKKDIDPAKRKDNSKYIFASGSWCYADDVERRILPDDLAEKVLQMLADMLAAKSADPE